MKFIIFLASQSRYAPPRVGSFSFSNEHNKHIYLGRELDADEFNTACDLLLVKRQGIPSHMLLSCKAVKPAPPAAKKAAKKAAKTTNP